MKVARIFITTVMMAHYVRSFRVQLPVAREKYALQLSGSSLSSLSITPNYARRSFCRLYSSASPDEEGRKRLVFLGTPEVAADSLKRLYEESQKDDCPYEVVGVVTQPPKRRRRKGKLEPSPVGLVAEEIGIPVLCPDSAKDPDFLEDLETNVKPHLCITAAYGQYLPKRFLATPPLGTVNIHPSLLPKWRGASPVQRSLEAGENPIGVTVLYTVSKMDAGPIIRQKSVVIGENDDSAKVLPWMFEIGTELLIDAMPDILARKITFDTATPQDESEVTKAAMIHSSEAEIKLWEESSRTAHDRLRGFSMWPGAFLYLQTGDFEPIKYKILETRVLDETSEPTNDVVKGPSKKDGLRLVCYDGSILEVLRLQPNTRKAMDALSFVNGLQGKTVKWVKPPVPVEA